MQPLIFVNSKKTVKGSVNEGGLRVPTIAAWPSKIKAGSKSDHPSIFYDFFATMADIVGSPLPYPTDGISYLPTLVGEKQIKHDYLYWEFPEKQYKGQQAIRTDNWKGIKKNLLKGKRCNSPCKECNAEGTVLGKSHASAWRKIYKFLVNMLVKMQ